MVANRAKRIIYKNEMQCDLSNIWKCEMWLFMRSVICHAQCDLSCALFCLDSLHQLIRFWPMFLFYTPWKPLNTKSFLAFSRTLARIAAREGNFHIICKWHTTKTVTLLLNGLTSNYNFASRMLVNIKMIQFFRNRGIGKPCKQI